MNFSNFVIILKIVVVVDLKMPSVYYISYVIIYYILSNQ